jgi:hypothetical protein
MDADYLSVASFFKAAVCLLLFLITAVYMCWIAGYPPKDPNNFFVIPSAHRAKNSSVLVFVTSDNVFAGEQIQAYTGHPLTLLSPQGCHIELDPSKECYQFTTKYWFLLSLSDLLVSQTYGEYNAPTSSFSRYAAIYALKPETPLRSGKYCGDTVFSGSTLSWISQGNWFC